MFTFKQPKNKEKPAYLILLELEKNYSEKKLKKFCEDLDNHLQKNINDYKQMRNEFGRLDKPSIGIVKKGSFKTFDKKRLCGSGQPKPIIIGKNHNIQKEFEITKIIS